MTDSQLLTAQNLPAERPQCPNGHGAMVLRNPPGGHTPEQQFCGTWYDCPPGPAKCASSVLLTSPGLDMQLAQQRRERRLVNRR